VTLDLRDRDAAPHLVTEYRRRRELEVPDGVDGVGRAVDGVCTLVDLAGVGGLPVGGDGAPAPALVRDGHVGHARPGVARRALADDRVVGGESLVYRVPCADAADLLADERGEDEFTGRVAVAEGAHRGRERALHVGRPAAVEAAVALLDDVLAVLVDLFVVRRHHVVVADQRERGVAASPAGDHVSVAPLVGAGVVAGHVGVGVVAEPPLDEIAGGGLGLVARNRDEVASQLANVHAGR